MRRPQSPRRLFGGAVAVAGLATAFAALRLPLGTVANFGPGLFPLAVGAAATLLGLLTTVRPVEPATLFDTAAVRPQTSLVLVAVVVFGLILDAAGLMLSSAVLVSVVSAASPHSSWRHTIVLAILLSVSAAVVFVLALGMPVAVWPRGLGRW